MTEEEIKQRNESKEFLKDLQYYLFQNKRSPKIDNLSILLDNDEKRIEELEAQIERLKGDLELWESGACRATNLDKCGIVKELRTKLEALEGQTPWKDIKNKSELIGKLAEAKEIIKGLLSLVEMDDREYEEEYKKAEQFLKGE